MTDEQIETLLTLPKRVTNPQARWKEQRGARQRNYDVVSSDGRQQFRLFLRQNLRLDTNFSCGLYHVASNGTEICLTRYNGSDHLHSNPLESSHTFGGYHIHKATERYIRAGRKPEHFAVQTDRYSTLQGALQALCADCRIDGLQTSQGDLFA